MTEAVLGHVQASSQMGQSVASRSKEGAATAGLLEIVGFLLEDFLEAAGGGVMLNVCGNFRFTLIPASKKRH